GHKPLAKIDDLPLFSQSPAKPTEPDPVVEAVKACDPDSLTPKAALELVYRLRNLLNEQE
ncbi:MAG: hypothetical protein ACKVG0_00295, partial [Alphaproteobacteria bacterium]